MLTSVILQETLEEKRTADDSAASFIDTFTRSHCCTSIVDIIAISVPLWYNHHIR